MTRTAPISVALAALLALPLAVRSESPDLFAKKPHRWRTEDLDKRFLKTRIAKALQEPPADPACARVVASLLMAFSEAAPYFHKKDENFFLFQTIIAPIATEDFPAEAYLRHMVRRAMLDKKAPEAWLKTAKVLRERHKAPIDLARLAYAVDGPMLIDSVYFSLAVFLERYQAEVALAPSLAQASAQQRFRDQYLDRDLTWGGLVLADIHKEDRPKKRKGKAALDAEEDEGPSYIATLVVPVAAPVSHPIFKAPKQEPIRVRVKLMLQQYFDLTKAVVSSPYIVRGRLWDFKVGDGAPGTPPLEFEIRDGLLFEDRDWSRYAGFAQPGDAEACALCINDLSPLGLKQKQGVGLKDGFAH
ncbi:MAG: hypothetical protein ACOX6T_07255 [Myxococcales bacterium]|jgi:hypothetical protein